MKPPSILKSDANFITIFNASVRERLVGGVAEWLRRSVSNLVRSARVGSNPLVGMIDRKATVTQLSILPRSVNAHLEVALSVQRLDTH